MLSAITDPEGVEQRRKHRLKRRVYQNKVMNTIIIVLVLHNINFLYLICAGTRLSVAHWWLWQAEAFWISNTWMYRWVRLMHFYIISCCYANSYSRRIQWLHVSTTNNDPYVIAGYYLEVVRKVGGMLVIHVAKKLSMKLYRMHKNMCHAAR